MSGLRIFGASLVLLALGLSGATRAQDKSAVALPTSPAQLEERLKGFDPQAVAAARHYYQSPQMRDNMLAMLRNFAPTLIANQEKAQGAPLSEADRAKTLAAINTAMSENFDLLLELNMVTALETLSKEELVALDQFYSSPTGQAILTKMPQIGKRMPAMMQIFLPKFMDSFRASMKAGKP